ncbi:hypothetical protein LZ554_000569 [Drepanopeziza brunnea f. sp. 'monogermtubi']|nr:hypothetical protein LZ554_000569 [Drepanopeziza brunnea f. sp. 'monogermtubi']
MITAQKYNTINSIGDNEIDEDALDQVLGDIDLHEGNFFELDYLFIPVDNGSHHMLVGVAPKQKFVFAIDSIGTSEKGIMAIMRRCVPEVTFAKYNRILVPNSSFWPIFRQWSSRANKTLD